MLAKPQWIAVALAALAFAAILWGAERRPPELRGVDERRAANMTVTSPQALIREAFGGLDARQEAELHGLEKMLGAAGSDRRRREVLQDLSGAWYRAGAPAIAGHYAQEVAELAPSDTTWGIAGTTYALCLRDDSISGKAREFCLERAVAAYESAASLAPDNSSHRVNLALLYADNPPPDNPMRGIRMLLDLNRAEPDDVAVLVQLGRLALRTSQNDRALERLKRAVALAPDNRSAQCLLTEAARREGDAPALAASEAACRALTEADPNS